MIDKYSIRTEIEVLPADKPIVIEAHAAFIINCRGKMIKRSKLLGWKIYETTGIAIINTKGLSKLTKTSKVIE